MSEEDKSESIRIAHLTMLQGVISRMGSNSFTLKALSATFGSAAVAIMAYADKPSPYYAIAAVLPILIFWLMDAQYLRYERAYRSLFNRVRKGEEIEPYDLDASPFMDRPWAVLKIAISWSVSCFYLAIFLALAFISFLIATEG